MVPEYSQTTFIIYNSLTQYCVSGVAHVYHVHKPSSYILSMQWFLQSFHRVQPIVECLCTTDPFANSFLV